jgi:tetratricopeptide (TPR) repeat protein
MKRRFTGAGAPAEPASAPRKDPTRELRHAQELLRDSQYARAEEVLRALIEQTPSNDVVRAYHMWSQLRASHSLDPAQLVTLRDLAKKLVPDQEHAGFGCYVLAHLFLADKKDEQAEKYFRKAHQLDKNNKDAERHVVILERRKTHGSDGDSGGQRKIFGISFNKPKE